MQNRTALLLHVALKAPSVNLSAFITVFFHISMSSKTYTANTTVVIVLTYLYLPVIDSEWTLWTCPRTLVGLMSIK